MSRYECKVFWVMNVRYFEIAFFFLCYIPSLGKKFLFQNGVWASIQFNTYIVPGTETEGWNKHRKKNEEILTLEGIYSLREYRHM